MNADAALQWLRLMLLIRHFEERCAQEYGAGNIRGFLHLCVGQEACAAGLVTQLQPDDPIVSHYREHGHALARGLPARAVMAELFGKQEGCSRGRGGSMHLFDVSRHFYGGNAIVSGGMPVAAGLALASKLTGRAQVTACIIGDGSVAEGAFHETLNLAALWQLPVLFACENNLYAMGTALARHQARTDLAVRAASYGLYAEAVDGMDATAVADAARRAVSHVRGGGGPAFLELKTYRFRSHSMFDPELYRGRDEVEAWKRRDPLALFEQRLRTNGLLDDSRLSSLVASVEAEVEDAVAYAAAGTLEPVSRLLDHVTAPVVEGRT